MQRNVEKYCYEQLKELYGEQPEQRIFDRLKRELEIIAKSGSAEGYVNAKKVVELCKEKGYKISITGETGGSFVNYLYGISDINPLEPHYRCSKCKYTEFIDKNECKMGYDLKQRKCPICGYEMIGDGVDIPAECYYSFEDIEANRDRIRLVVPASKCIRIKKELINDYDIEKITPHWSLDMCEVLDKATQINISDMEYWNAVSHINWGGRCFLSDKISELIRLFKPKKFNDLVRILALEEAGYTEYLKPAVIYGACGHNIENMICTREDVFEYMLKFGASAKEARWLMEKIRKGLGIYMMFYGEKGSELFEKYRIPVWFIAMASHIRYLPQRASMVSKAKMLLKLSWYGQNYPMEFCLACPVECQGDVCRIPFKWI